MTLDARDQASAAHSVTVRTYARAIAVQLGLNEDEQDQVELAAVLHDVGKIRLPAGLLEKPGVLTLEERRQMQEHVAIGERIIAANDRLTEVARIVRHHHERWDGLGYPDGLAGEEIPMPARIVSVANALDNLTRDLPYRRARTPEAALEEIRANAGTQFCPEAVTALEGVHIEQPGFLAAAPLNSLFV
jgi:putative nucleotidyltransferase with HDIG domain